jgi:hypothetical protein
VAAWAAIFVDIIFAGFVQNSSSPSGVPEILFGELASSICVRATRYDLASSSVTSSILTCATIIVQYCLDPLL